MVLHPRVGAGGDPSCGRPDLVGLIDHHHPISRVKLGDQVTDHPRHQRRAVDGTQQDVDIGHAAR
jgi:hypothetical protein